VKLLAECLNYVFIYCTGTCILLLFPGG